MKRTLLLAALCVISLSSYGQVKLGLRFSPTINTHRILSLSDTIAITPEKSSFLMVLGLFSEFPITETYSISTGIHFAPKRVNLAFDGLSGDNYPNDAENYRLQYLQVPIFLKLFTDDIQPGFRAYFQVGPILDINIFDSPLDNDYRFITNFRPVDASIAIGAGTEFELGVSTVAFGGFTYNRGLVNVVASSIPMDANFHLKQDFFQIELGLKF